jgi:hypothetical protein
VKCKNAIIISRLEDGVRRVYSWRDYFNLNPRIGERFGERVQVALSNEIMDHSAEGRWLESTYDDP